MELIYMHTIEYVILILYTLSTTSSSQSTCPKTIPRGKITDICERVPSSICSFTCDVECYRSVTYLICEDNLIWNKADEACICPDLNDPDLCQSTIPNGKLELGCSRSPGSMCTYTCESNSYCFPTRRYLTCSTFKRWDFGYTACACTSTSTTSAPNLTEHEPSNNVAISVGTTVGVFVPVIVVLMIAFMIQRRHRRRHLNAQQSNAHSALASGEMPRYTNTIQDQGFVPSLDSTRPPPYLNTNVQGRMEYRNVLPGEQGPCTPPPSYEEVHAHPLEFSKKDDV